MDHNTASQRKKVDKILSASVYSIRDSLLDASASYYDDVVFSDVD